jgi:hypothetical protein
MENSLPTLNYIYTRNNTNIHLSRPTRTLAAQHDSFPEQPYTVTANINTTNIYQTSRSSTQRCSPRDYDLGLKIPRGDILKVLLLSWS